MTHELTRLADLIISRPLAILPAKLTILHDVLAGRLKLGAFTDAPDVDELPEDAQAFLEGSRFVGVGHDGRRALAYQRTAEGVAVISIVGSLVNRGAWLGANSGLVSYEGVRAQLDAALADPETRSILLDIESPGGQVIGMLDLASAVRAARAAKPVIASINGMAASAAYCIAAAASRVIVDMGGVAGSIGIVMMHSDYSRALDKAGVGVTLIHAGARKVDGNPYEPLSREVKADLQAEVDAAYSAFVKSVAANRPKLSQTAIRAQQARVFTGQAAVDAGLADAVGSFADALAMATRLGRGERATLPSSPAAAPRVDPARAQAMADAFAADLIANRAAAAATQSPPAAAPIKTENSTMTSTIEEAEASDAWTDVIGKLNADHARNTGRAPVDRQQAAGEARHGATGATALSSSEEQPQAAADPRSAVVERLNAEARGNAAAVSIGASDSDWSAIAAKLNREAGLDEGARRREAATGAR